MPPRESVTRELVIDAAHTHTHNLALKLVVAIGLMLALFYFGFTARYPLSRYVDNDFIGNIAILNKFQVEGALLYVGIFAALFVIYLIVARWIGSDVQPARSPVSTHRLFALIFAGGVLFNVALVPQYTFDAQDIYDLIVRGRMTTYYGLNPLVNVPDDLRRLPSVAGDVIADEAVDPLLRFAAWQSVPGAYGAGWELTAGALARLAGHDLTQNVRLFKMIQVLAYAVSLLAIYLTLRHHAPDRALTGALLFGWNPFLISMIGGGGHNDALMVMFMAVSLYCLVRRWLVVSIWVAIAGATVKFIPLLIIPIIGIIAFRTLKSGVLKFASGV